jgi:amino acid adenylation domain-containing protein
LPGRYDLHFLLTGEERPAPLVVTYNAKLFRAATIERIIKSLLLLFPAAIAQPDVAIGRLPVLDAADTHRLTVEWASGKAHYAEEPVHLLFEALARERPTALAATFQQEQITYGELSARSNQLARYLISAGVTAEKPVAVCVSPSIDILVAMLAIWKAGGVYVPLDPTHPQALIFTILEESQPALILTQQSHKTLLEGQDARLFFLDSDRALVADLSRSSPDVDVRLSQPSHLLYTSGTTGRPKGALATHGNLAHYIHVSQQTYRFGATDVFCSLARYTFSISLFELLSPLCCGGSLRLLARDDVLSPERLSQTLREVTVVHAGPSLLSNLFRYQRATPSAPRTYPGIRHASSGGDMVPPHVLEEMKRVFADAEIYVIYGCTEVSCMGATYPVGRDTTVAATYVGKPFPDVALRVLDLHRNLVPIGVVGEICFAGKGVVSGYLGRPELTAGKFVQIDGVRFYQTGDMGRLHSDGNLEILGRRDFQVQVRGIRIELAGIENMIRELGLAAQCAVVLKRLDDQDARLVAFVVAPRETNVAAVRRELGTRLPDYMLPQHLVVLDALPVTANGKLDRNRLQELPWETRPQVTVSGESQSLIEQKVATAFASALSVERVGLDDDFFTLGGHSLLAILVTQQLENTLGLTFSSGVVFEHPTVRALAAYAENAFPSMPRPILLGAPAMADRPALFLLAGVHLYRELARLLDGACSVYGVYAGRELLMFDAAEKVVKVEELACEYVEIIRRQQDVGPYCLAGMSFGGIVAFEAAQQLRAAGQEVAFLGLIDAVLPERLIEGCMDATKRFLGLPRQQMVELLAQKVRSRLLPSHSGGSTSEFATHQDDRRVASLEERRLEMSRQAVSTYLDRLRPFHGNVSLIVAGQRAKSRPLNSPTCGWNYRILPSMRVHTLDADHLSLLEPPSVAELAKVFIQGLDRSRHHRGKKA